MFDSHLPSAASREAVISDPFLCFSSFACGAHVPAPRKKKGCSKAALRDLQCYQRLKTYIVTSKPKRISVYSGLVHMVRLLRELIHFIGCSRSLPHDLGAYSVAAGYCALQEKTEIRVMIFIRFAAPYLFLRILIKIKDL